MRLAVRHWGPSKTRVPLYWMLQELEANYWQTSRVEVMGLSSYTFTAMLYALHSCLHLGQSWKSSVEGNNTGDFGDWGGVICQCDFINYIWLSVDKKNQLDVTFVFFISLLIIAQYVSGNHVPIIRSLRLRDVIALCWYVPWLQEGGQVRLVGSAYFQN